MIKKTSLFLLLAFSFFKLSAQVVSDSLFFSKAKDSALVIFNKQYAAQLDINKGTIFRPINQNEFYGSTLLGENLIYKGNVFYQGEWYNNVDLAYDVKSDNLIHIKTTGEWILLIKSAIKYFNLEQRNFINLTSNDEETNGFYELIRPGKKAQLLAKHNILINKFHAGTFKKEINHKIDYIVSNKEKLYTVKSRNDLIKALEDKKVEVLNFIKKGGLSFKGNLENTIKAVVEFYNGLN